MHINVIDNMKLSLSVLFLLYDLWSVPMQMVCQMLLVINTIQVRILMRGSELYGLSS